MKIKNLFFLLWGSLFGLGTKAQEANIPASIYDFKLTGLDGSLIDLSKYKGKKILIVNTASKCGYTPQYEGLEKLYETHKDKLVIIGCPANNFLFQEPGSAEEIQSFCKRNYGVTFPMTQKMDVVGKDMNSLYVWLTKKRFNKLQDSKVKWNFQKYLIDEKGNLIAVFEPGVEPLSQEIVSKL